MITLQLFYEKLPEYLRDSFYKRLQKKVLILDKHLSSHNQPILLRITAEQFKNSEFIVKAQLFHRGTIVVKRNGRTANKALELAFNDLKENVLQDLSKEREQQKVQTRTERSYQLNEAYSMLSQVVQKQDKESFTKQLLPLLTDLNKYVIRRIRFAQIRGIVPPQTINVNDIVQGVIERAYEGFTTIPESRTFEHWLFHIANELLENRFKEEQFEESQIQSWEDFKDINTENIDERLTVNFSGELEHQEDLMEPTLEQEAIGYDPYGPEYRGAENYPEDRASREELVKKTVVALSKLPETERTIFDLYAMGQYTEKEIAAIHNIKVQEVKEAIKRVQKFVKKELAMK